MPDLITLADHNGDWDAWLAAAYEAFSQDFLTELPLFDGRRMGLKRHPVEAGKEATFWHFVSTGKIEADRIPEFRRLERIAWPRAVIDNCADAAVKRWSEPRDKEPRIHLWCEQARYLVVLADRGDYVLPWTAYPIEHDHQAVKLNKRFVQFT